MSLCDQFKTINRENDLLAALIHSKEHGGMLLFINSPYSFTTVPLKKLSYVAMLTDFIASFMNV